MMLRLRRGGGSHLRVSGVTTASSAVHRESAPIYPNALWIADLREVPTAVGPLYVCAVLDCCTARCLGWRTSEVLSRGLIAEGVEAALATNRPAPFPFDRPPLGNRLALRLGPRCAAVRLRVPTLDPQDDAVAARFFDWLNADLLITAKWPSRRHATLAIADWILGYYNPALLIPRISLHRSGRASHQDASGST